MRGWDIHWRGHLLAFGERPVPAYPAPAGLRLLVIVLVLELLLGPRLEVLALLGLPGPPAWIRVPALLLAALLLVRVFAGVGFRQIGLRPWREWSAVEKSYFLQLLILGNGIFAVLYGPQLQSVAFFATCFLWGFHQELIYRGFLQTELVRRYGAVAGVLAANVAYTFGPLHFGYLGKGAAGGLMLGSIFAIGLFFGALRHRSGNLWIVAIVHGVGTAYILGAHVPSRAGAITP